MAKTKTKKQTLKTRLEVACGIDLRTLHGGRVSDLLNFRILPDGSLQKREGFRCICSAPEEVRAVWSGRINGEFRCYYLAGSSLCSLDLGTGESYSCASILSSSGKARFFYLRDALYLIDGIAIYKIVGVAVSEVGGYVPLFGKDWGTGYPGEINEPLNILNRRARITYKIGPNPSAYLPTLHPVREIAALYKNGALISPSLYYFDEELNTINISGLEEGDSVEADLTFDIDDSIQKDALLSSKDAYVFGGINNSRLFTFGGDIKNTVFTSTYVNRESLADAEAHFAGCGHIYFKEGNQFAVGDGRYPIKGVTRHYDRLLILTEGDAWMADSSACGEEEFPVMNVNSRTGCVSEGGVVSVGNDPVSVGRTSIYRWTTDTDELNDCNAYPISEQIDALLSRAFLNGAVIYADPYRKEIWLTDPEGDGVVWIYDLEHKAWTRFDNIYASLFFDADGAIGFVGGRSICVFDDSCYSDIESVGESEGTPISAKLSISSLDLGSPSQKRLLSLLCIADLDGSSARVVLYTDMGEEIRIELSDAGKLFPYERRISSHRFRYADLSLTLSSIGRQTIHSLELEAR